MDAVNSVMGSAVEMSQASKAGQNENIGFAQSDKKQKVQAAQRGDSMAMASSGTIGPNQVGFGGRIGRALDQQR